MPYLTVRTLYSLLHYDSKPVITEKRFGEVYRDWARKEENRRYLVEEKINFGRGYKGKFTLNSAGLTAFAKQHVRSFQFCVENMKNFIEACELEFTRFQVKGSELPKVAMGRTEIASVEQFPATGLYEGLETGQIYNNDSVNFLEMQGILESTNVFYIMELADNWFRAGHTRQQFRVRLRDHPSYIKKNKNFVGFYGIYLFKDSSEVDASTLEMNFFLQAPKILGKRKLDVQVTKAEHNNAFQVTDKRQIQLMLELCLTNKRTQYQGLVQPVTNLSVLDELAKGE